MSKFEHSLLGALLAGTSAFALMSSAIAQEAAVKTDSVLGEIVVTAEKRAENLQLTPIAISAITSAQIELQGIADVRDISGLAPNVSVLPGTTNATAAIISIRGIPTPGDETQGFDTPIGLYVDGVYMARSSAAAFEVADIERVEVLRGPQGTLFGRNTTGGAVNFITKLPGDDQSLNVKFGYGNYGQFTARAIYNMGAMNDDKLRVSLGYIHKQRNGTVDNLLQPQKSHDPGSNNTNAGRFALTYEVSDSVKITNILDYGEIAGVPSAQQLGAVGDGTFRPNVSINGGVFSQVQPANVGGYLAQSTIQAGCTKQVSLTRLDTICLDQAGVSTDKVYGDLFRIEADLGDNLSVRSSTSWRGWRNTIRGSDLDGLGQVTGSLFTSASLFNGMPASLLAFIPSIGAAAPFVAAAPIPTTSQPFFQASNIRRQNQVSQEVELVSNTGGQFEYVVGAFYFHERGAESNAQSFGSVQDTNQIFLANFGALGPAFVAANPSRFRIFSIPSSTLTYRAGGDSYAVYGQGTYRPGGKDGAFGVTAGVRYTWDKKRMTRTQNGATPFVTATDIALNDVSKSFSAATGNVTLDYRATDDINLYARVARGYRSGGYNARQNAGALNGAPNIPLIPFNDEKIMSYEIGAKAEFFGRLRLNVAGFYNSYTNQLSTVPIPGGATFGTQVINAGKTVYIGYEAEAQYRVNEYLGLDGSVGYVHKDPKNFPGVDIAGVTRNIASVITIGASPDYTANAGVNFTYPVGDDAKLNARVGWSYVSSQVGFPNPLSAPFQAQTKFESHGLWDAQLRLSDLKVGVGNGLGVTFWVKNMTDRHYVARSVDFGALGYAGTIYGDPRTFGANVELAF